MDIKALRYFLMVANEGTISKAADKLFIAQPPLSRQIQKLEQELGVTLFERGKRQIRLTDEGQFLKQRAEEIITLVEKTESQLEMFAEDTNGMISIGVTDSCGASLIPDLIEKFHRKYPLIRYNVWCANGDEVHEKLDKGLVDMGIVREPFNMEQYDSSYIRTEYWIAVMSRKHPLAMEEEDTVELSQLAKEQLLIPSRPPVQNEINTWFNEVLQERNIFCLYNTLSCVIPLVEKNVGIAICPESVRSVTNWRRLRYKKIVKPEHPSRVVILRKRGQIMSAAAGCFWEFVKQEAEHLEKDL